MDVTIHYCRACGFGERAEQIAGELQRRLGLKSETRPGWWGTFRIEHGGEEVFNRWKTRGLLGRIGMGRTPTAAEVVSLFRGRFGGPAPEAG